jgi:hypothetical protein
VRGDALYGSSPKMQRREFFKMLLGAVVAWSDGRTQPARVDSG